MDNGENSILHAKLIMRTKLDASKTSVKTASEF